MHAVDRGREPPKLKAVRNKYTPRWVRYYRDGEGNKPSDDHWRKFQPDLSRVFSAICGYCEQSCKGQVDHFRPKSRYPQSVYRWSNWILACPTCNQNKGEGWPSGGYVDPCAKTRSAQPEAYFAFDTMTGEIVPKPGLSPTRHRKASQVIDDLQLNAYYHLKRRVKWLAVVEAHLRSHDPEDPDHTEFIRSIASRETDLSSITRAFLREHGYAVNEA
jgi:uncharacterized protein (TIGR02646 family)